MKTRYLAALLLLAATVARADLWTDDFEEAKAQAKAENKFLLLDFTGSDWCGWCKRLDAEVFEKSDFKNYAKDNLVLVKLDFPRGFSLKKKTAEQNDKLAKEFGITGYPSIILLDPDGKKLTKTGYQDGGAEAYVQHLESLLANERKKIGPVKAAAAATAGAGPSLGSAPGTGGNYRTWTAASGKTLEARVEQRVGTKIYLRTRENKLITIDSSSLSPEDQSFLSGRP
jgi:thioredoxin-related protein